MDMEKPPIKVLAPGRVFRSDSDATHSPMFHQMEGLVVDKGITLCDLQGMLDKFVQALFGACVPLLSPSSPESESLQAAKPSNREAHIKILLIFFIVVRIYRL